MKKYTNKTVKCTQGTYVKVKGLDKHFFLISRYDNDENPDVVWLSEDDGKEITIKESEVDFEE